MITIFNLIGGFGGGSTPITEIGDISFTWNKNQRSDTPVVLTSTVSLSITVLNHIWIIYDSSGTVVDVNFGRTPSFNISTKGAYTIKYIVETATDSNIEIIPDAFTVHEPRFDIGDADVVVDFSTNVDYYSSHTGIDRAGYKIALINATTSGGHKFELNNIKSSDPTNPVRIQAFGDAEVIGNSSVFHTWWFSGDCDNITIDGYKEDGTHGLRITNLASTGQGQLTYHDGRFTGIKYYGCTLNHNAAIDGAAFSIVGQVRSDSNNTNWKASGMVLYDNVVNNAGEEGAYLNDNNDNLVSGYYPYQWDSPLLAWNTFNGSGRDSIQIGSAFNINMHHNTCINFGKQMDAGGQTNCISWNGGATGRCYNNIGYGGKVFLNIQSGNFPFDVYGGETVPRHNYFFQNVFYQGDYSAWSGGTSEPVAIYIQNKQDSGNSGPWNNYIWGNTFICDKKGIEQYYHKNSFSSDKNTFINNIFVLASASATTTEYNITGNVITANAATTGNITLSGIQTIDGVSSPAIVLVRANTDAKENGVWFPAAGAWTRSTSADSPSELNQLLVKVTGGTQINTIWAQTTVSPTIGVNNIVFANVNSGILINNLNRIVGTESDILFTTYTSPTGTNPNLKPSALTSVALTGSPTDVATRIPEMSSYVSDYEGFPLIYSSAYAAFGAYSDYSLRTAPFVPSDASAATFTTPLAVGTLTQSGGTITFEANKQGRLFWVVVADGAAAPTKTQIRAGQNASGAAALDSGSILDLGTAASYVITSGAQGTAYDLYAVFVTKDGIEQTSATKVDYSTTSDVTAPTISTFVINDANKDRIYFSSSEVITASTVGGFTVATPTKTISSVTINSGQTTGHYFTVSVPFVYGETPTLAYSGSGSNLQDGVGNALASFTATSITNNIAAGVLEAFVWVDGTGSPTISGGDLTTTTTATTARSTQIIPAASGGRIVCSWDVLMQASAGGWKFGLIGSSDARTAANIKMTCNYLANTNTDIYEGTTYKSTVSGASGIQASGQYHSWRIDRGTSKIYFETSTDLTNWTLRATYSSTTTGDLRGGFVSTQTGKKVPSAQIQADLGLT